MAKEKMPLEKKAKLIYSGELILFSIVFIVIATLEITAVIGKREVMMIIYNWVTIFGAAWMIADFIWLMCSKRRKARNSIIDKALLLPLAVFLITYDIICFANASFVDIVFRRNMMAVAFYYIAAVFLFQGIYHWFKPVPGFLEDLQEEGEEKKKKEVVGEAQEEDKEKADE